jgi:hypothetical protein
MAPAKCFVLALPWDKGALFRQISHISAPQAIGGSPEPRGAGRMAQNTFLL